MRSSNETRAKGTKAARRPRVTRVLETCLHVEDVERSARFYEDLFGFKRMVYDGRFCAFDVAKGSVLLLFRRGGTLEPVKVPGGIIPPHDGSGHMHFAFAIPPEDLTPWIERLKNAGIAIESRVHWEPGGESIYFRDPDEHLVELATPGIWPNY
jgi:catechol 2,3-dioxygenase-like lactoylglutathione lyase family enzyme